MIFILNPCHLTTLLFGIVSILPLSRITELLYPFAIGGCFGAWLGIVWAENGELSYIEHVCYYIQHYFAAFLAPLVIYFGGRFSISDHLRWPVPLYGFVGFTIYMRYVLTPMAAITWANLNHSLCSVDNDPWKAYFGMHKYYYMWAEFYLALTSVVTQYFVSILAFVLVQWRSFTIHGGETGIKLRQVGTGVFMIVTLGSFATYAIGVLKASDAHGYNPDL